MGNSALRRLKSIDRDWMKEPHWTSTNGEHLYITWAGYFLTIITVFFLSFVSLEAFWHFCSSSSLKRNRDCMRKNCYLELAHYFKSRVCATDAIYTQHFLLFNEVSLYKYHQQILLLHYKLLQLFNRKVTIKILSQSQSTTDKKTRLIKVKCSFFPKLILCV